MILTNQSSFEISAFCTRIRLLDTITSGIDAIKRPSRGAVIMYGLLASIVYRTVGAEAYGAEDVSAVWEG